MNLFNLVITNTKNYGLFQTAILILYEIFYSLNIKYYRHIFYDESVSDEYHFYQPDIADLFVVGASKTAWSAPRPAAPRPTPLPASSWRQCGCSTRNAARGCAFF